ncbi:hypothetical protein J4E82_007681 [Alternaria postmessia]|uniref:uncharacterized protein n=1 Tax=Alternaria postmessia TaxID=1187938 RepID=UPI002224D830|nr:uncharacterized protein J4E82_007681 [Alternaria postmessia]KAI5373633.1 hypothetical protein J4E82_007681 [Alternaria postmessia]
MKLHILHILAIVALASAHILPPTSTDSSTVNLTRDAYKNADADGAKLSNISDDHDPSIVHTLANPPTKFEKAISIGQTLDSAMRSKDSVARWFFKDFPQFAETCQSPFTGDGKAELAKWGFDDSDALSATVAKECDFDGYHKIKAAFDELGLDTRSSASFEFAVNPNGLIALMNVMSMTYSAKTYTWFRTPLPEELPHIGTTQDIAWAMWNRVDAPDLAGLKYLLVTQVMNAGSRELFRSALETLNPPQSEYKLWPGEEFKIETKGGKAILGSPVGRWAGYLLLQHKDQLGGNRYIEKVRLFKPPGASLPYLLFYVAKEPAAGQASLTEAEAQAEKGSLRVARREMGGKNFLRKHVIHMG